MDWISKKELLKETGISYGQLYRWKRERLIPEEWFIKQSSFTGQETVFPREEILARIRLILESKDQYSLEELAQMLSPETTDASIPREVLLSMEEISPAVRAAIPRLDARTEYTFLELVLYAAVSQIVREQKLTEEETGALVRKVSAMTPSLQTTSLHCTIFLVNGAYHAVFSKSSDPLFFDQEIQKQETRSLQETADTLKGKYPVLFFGQKKEKIEEKST